MTKRCYCVEEDTTDKNPPEEKQEAEKASDSDDGCSIPLWARVAIIVVSGGAFLS